MKHLLFIVILVAVVMAAGCTGGNQNTPVTPTPKIVYVTVFVTPTQAITRTQVITSATPASIPVITTSIDNNITITIDSSKIVTQQYYGGQVSYDDIKGSITSKRKVPVTIFGDCNLFDYRGQNMGGSDITPGWDWKTLPPNGEIFLFTKRIELSDNSEDNAKIICAISNVYNTDGSRIPGITR